MSASGPVTWGYQQDIHYTRAYKHALVCSTGSWIYHSHTETESKTHTPWFAAPEADSARVPQSRHPLPTARPTLGRRAGCVCVCVSVREREYVKCLSISVYLQVQKQCETMQACEEKRNAPHALTGTTVTHQTTRTLTDSSVSKTPCNTYPCKPLLHPR